MRAHFGLPSVSNEEDKKDKPPITVKFEIPYFTVSGIQVRYLKIIEKSGYQVWPPAPAPPPRPTFARPRRLWSAPVPSLPPRRCCPDSSQALPWVRYITQNGDYQLRMS